MIGKSQQKSISKVLPTSNILLLEVLLLLILGALAIVLRAKLRMPINVPGHHGLEVMAIIIAGRRITNIKYGSSISTLTAALFIFFPFMGFKDPFLPAIYILMGLSIDILYTSFAKWQKNIIFLSLLGGIAYMVIPIARIIIHFITGYPYHSFIKHGFVTPVFTHFMFGLGGALLCATIIKSFKK